MVATLPGVVFLATVFFAHKLPGLSTDCFLDKVCIHQTDPALKRKGIDSLGGFLAHSKRMVCDASPSVGNAGQPGFGRGGVTIVLLRGCPFGLKISSRWVQ